MTPQRLVRIAVYLVIAVVVGLVFFNEISKVYFLKDENKRIEKRIEDLNAQNDAYRQEIKSIEQDQEYLEKILREELGMIKDKEKIFRFKER